MKYVDADYARDFNDRRLTTDFMFTLVGRPICWKSMIQSTVAMSTTKAEYMAAAEAAKETLWLIGLVKELHIQQGGVLLHWAARVLYIYLIESQVYHVRTKHICLNCENQAHLFEVK
jgi:hypothetical protein